MASRYVFAAIISSPTESTPDGLESLPLCRTYLISQISFIKPFSLDLIRTKKNSWTEMRLYCQIKLLCMCLRSLGHT